MRPRAAVVGALAAAALLGAGGCGGDDDQPTDARTIARACDGATSGAAAMHGGGDAEARVRRAERTATEGARALDDHKAPTGDDVAQEEAVSSLLGQSLRLRLVREQMKRGTAPATVLEAAGAGLEAGDDQARERLAAIGIDC